MTPASGPTVAHLWRDRIAKTPTATAFEYRAPAKEGVRSWVPMTWRQADEHVRRIAAGLISLGLPKGARVAIVCRTRVEWILVDLGVLLAGGATSTIYPSSTPAECDFILQDSGCWGVVAEDADQLAKIGVAGLQRIVIDGGAGADVLTLDALEDRGAALLAERPSVVDDRIDALGPEDLATLIYTSGTTGRPKGVILVHDNWVFQGEALLANLGSKIQEGDKQYLFLPLSHSFGKVLELMAIVVGVPTAVEGDTDVLLAGLAETRPTVMAAVPRVFEKIFNRIVTRARDAGPRRYRVFRWAARTGDRVVRARSDGARVGIGLRLRHALADRLVFRRLRAALGGRVRAFVSGGAPLSVDIARFFEAAGMTILEGYGLTETSAGAVGNRLDDYVFGTVGRPIPGCELAFGPEGEVLLRGRNVMRGYWNRPEATLEALRDGWFHTGDIGELRDGRLTITGRIKDLLITSGGKNIAPAPIENAIKARCPFVNEVVMLGDRRPFCIALVWLEGDAICKWADDRGAPGTLPELAERADVAALVWEAVAAVNAERPSYETVKHVVVLDHELLPESGLLTPSMKVKRSLVVERFASRIEGLYAGTIEQV